MRDRLKEATKLRQEALHDRKVALSADPINAVDFQMAAIYNETAAYELERPVGNSTVVSGEVVPSESERPDAEGGWALRDTLANPDTAAIVASMERIDLLTLNGNDVLALATDAAQSIPEANSLEKMLAHQLALMHKSAFRVMEKAMEQDELVDMTRLINAGARLMTAYQHGVLALNRLHTGGKQTVTVQHVTISGGQALVTGNLQQGGRVTHKHGGEDENE